MLETLMPHQETGAELAFAGILLMALIVSALLTDLLHRYAMAFKLLDIPNARSSHRLPTPRGGGLAIVIVFLAGLTVFALAGIPIAKTVWVICGVGSGVALVGFWDDHSHVPAHRRLMAHFIAAALGLYGLGGMPPLLVFGYSIAPAWFEQVFGLFYLVWLLNLYNFMDGIDGLAAIEAMTVCLGVVVLYLITSESTGQLWALALLGISVTGFLVWNFPPARIFMGDVGSGFLGIVLGLFSIQSAWIAPQFFWSWLILLGVFIVDATLTLMRRFLSGEKIYEAHRSHAYQVAARRYHAHKPVSVMIGIINVCWLLPLALWVGLGSLEGVFGLVIAYCPLIMLAIRFNAGAREAV